MIHCCTCFLALPAHKVEMIALYKARDLHRSTIKHRNPLRIFVLLNDDFPDFNHLPTYRLSMMFTRLVFITFLLFSIAVARDPPTVYLIRHGEKPAEPDNHGLTSDGVKRAQCLRQFFGAESGYNIGYIMAPTVKWSELMSASTKGAKN